MLNVQAYLVTKILPLVLSVDIVQLNKPSNSWLTYLWTTVDYV